MLLSDPEDPDIWWLPYEYDVIVTKREMQAPIYLSAVLCGM